MKETFDAIIVGSGFGGSMAAHELVNAGHRVLMLERGAWVKRGQNNWGPRGSIDLTEHYSFASSYRIEDGGPPRPIGTYACVSRVVGNSVVTTSVEGSVQVTVLRPALVRYGSR